MHIRTDDVGRIIAVYRHHADIPVAYTKAGKPKTFERHPGLPDDAVAVDSADARLINAIMADGPCVIDAGGKPQAL